MMQMVRPACGCLLTMILIFPRQLMFHPPTLPWLHPNCGVCTSAAWAMSYVYLSDPWVMMLARPMGPRYCIFSAGVSPVWVGFVRLMVLITHRLHCQPLDYIVFIVISTNFGLVGANGQTYLISAHCVCVILNPHMELSDLSMSWGLSQVLAKRITCQRPLWGLSHAIANQ